MVDWLPKPGFDPYGYAMTSANAVDDLMQKISGQVAAKQAGQAYANGDQTGAAQIYARAGNIGAAQTMQDNAQTLQEKSQDIADQGGDYAAKQYARAHALIGESHDALQSAYDTAEKQQPGSGGQALAQAFNSIPWSAAGVNPQQQQIASQKALSDPQGFLAATAQAKPKVTYHNVGDELYGLDDQGNVVVHKRGGRVLTLANGSGGQTALYYDPDGTAVPLASSSAGPPGTPPGGGAGGPAGAPPSPAGALPGSVIASAPPPAPPTGSPPPETVQGGAVMPAAFEQAIRGQEAPAGQAGAGIAGPMTPYGQAHGTFQVMDATGQALAQKLGIAWRPDLMRGQTPEAVQYQNTIGHAAAQDAWAHGGGDPASAAGYYYAGPDHKLWGPKTQAYQQSIVGRMGADTGTSQNTAATVGQSGGLSVTRAPDGTPVYTTAPKPPKPPGAPTGYQWDPQAPGHLAPIPGGPADSTEAPTLTPLAIDAMADQMSLNGGKVPQVGSGKAAAAMRTLVINRYAEKALASGQTQAQIQAQGYARHADSQALTAMTKGKSVIDSSEATASKAADLFMTHVHDLGNTPIPLINQVIIGVKRGTGDPKADAAIAQLGTLRDEYAKVISMSPTGSGGATATDAVRKEVERRYREAGSPEQLAAVVASMRQEMGFRSSSYADGIDQIQGRLAKYGGGNTPPANSQAAQQTGGGRFASRPRGWTNQLPPAQKRVMQSLPRSSAPAGSRANPFVPLTAGEAAKVRKSEFYIDTDGQIVPGTS